MDASTQVSGSRSDVTVDFDHHSEEVGRDPYRAYADLRGRCPVAWSEHHGGFWVLSDYESVARATRDDETFHSGPAISIPPAPTVHPLIPIETDAPLAQKYRRIVMPSLSPHFVARIEPSIQETVDGLIDEFIESGSCDLAGDLALPTAAITSLRWLGFETDQWREFVRHDHKIGHELATDPEGSFESAMWLFGQTATIIEARRAVPTDDVISELIRAEIDGEPLDDMTVANYVLNLLVGGLETVASTFCNALVRLDGDRALRQRLLDEPGILETAVEEFLRLDGSVQGLGRTLTCDTTVGGMEMREGERVQLLWASANRDEAKFPDADTFDPERSPNHHLAFGVGLHRCLGSTLARSMLRMLFSGVLTRMPDFEITDAKCGRYPAAGLLYAVHALPARFTPGSRRTR